MRQSYSDARVAELLLEYQRTGDARLRDQVVEHMRPLVQSVARKFAGREPLEDLESEGFVGLIRAVDRFTPGRGTRFSTFAMHLVAGQIRHYLRDRGHLIRQPAWLQELNTRVKRVAADLAQKLQREPTVAEIAEAANLTEEGVEELLTARQAAQIVRMESSTSAEEDDFLDVDPEKIRSRDYVTLELPIEDRIVLEGAMVKLKELEQNVLRYFFYHELNQSEIARRLGISCNYTGYVLRNGLKHMRERLPHERYAGVNPTAAEDSVVDESTGLYTLEHFERRLAEEISRSKHYDRPVSVCCLRLPSATAEKTMQAAAEVLRRRTRRADIAARTGPAEFAVIFPDTGLVAEEVATRLGEQVAAALKAPLHVASATFPDGGRSAQELLSAARDSTLPLSGGALPTGSATATLAPLKA